ncbi:hypothetical protein Cgig2_001783 [Carnegiea gigantea]|uniref:Uncharacterized protein n=1 Tax=Carnegiea gigantea TaxID=171969 RepID=A0A9Q1KGT6_9CARY|nr:hypothetical protein Cgig2_001783 [Carnegiea gigantea]
MASLMKEPKLFPRDAKDFKEVKENYDAKLLRNLREKFLIPKGVDVEKALSDIFGIKFRSMGHKQNKELFQHTEGNVRKNLNTILQAAGLFGDELEQTLKQHQFAMSDIEEELDKLPSTKDFSVARALKSHMHITGTESFAQYCAEFNDAKARMERHRASGLFTSEFEINKEVWTYFMGDDKPGRGQLCGRKVTKSQVKCLRDVSLISRNVREIIIDDATTTKLHHLRMYLSSNKIEYSNKSK